MSLSLNNVFGNASYGLQYQAKVIARLQEQASTGSRVNRASDAPTDAYRILGLDTQKKSLDSYMGTIGDIMGVLDTAMDTITKMTDTYLKVTELLASVTDTDGNIGQVIQPQAINNYLEELILFANWNYSGQSIFGGQDTSSQPYMVERTDGKITRVTYQGSDETRDIEVASGVESSAFFVGDDIFRSDERQAPEFILGTTGIEAGTGTSTVNGYVWLQVTQPGGAGTAYRLSIDGGVSYVDTAAFPPTETNLKITNSETGQILYVDATKITATGVDLVSVTGTHDIFNTLITIRDILENKKGLSNEQVKQLRESTVGTVDRMHRLLIESSVSVGSRINVLSNLKESLDDMSFNMEEEKTRLEEVDIAQVAVELARQQVLYEMSLAVVGKILSMSLLDYI